jgi:hypothetical protein
MKEKSALLSFIDCDVDRTQFQLNGGVEDELDELNLDEDFDN